MKQKVLKAAACLTAAMAAAVFPLSVPKSTWLIAPVTAFADGEDEEFTEGQSGDLYYKKYSDHIVITGGNWQATSVMIPSEIDSLPVTKIGDSAFTYFSLTSVTLPDTLVEIAQYAFCGCTNLSSVTFPDSLKRVDFQAFDECSALAEVNFPDHLVETSSNTFRGTPWLEAQRKENPLVIVNGALIDGQTCKGDVTVPAGVKYVAGSAFAYNTDLTSVVLPSSAAAVEANVFNGCEKLTSATLKGVTDLDYGTFAECSQLTDLKLSGKLTHINYGTFEDNNATATITFYGTEDTWKAVERDPEDAFLNRAKMVFDPNGPEPDEPGDDPVIGDINKDGACDMSDAVLLMGWLLKEDVTLADWEAGDMNKDGKLTAADFTLLKRHLLA
ncbi:MAG: leucine-rich repeat protein [Oscillospiraceae bacterium]|nr:leucine-rich repeat protein [Oscillospiraceae bacterium]